MSKESDKGNSIIPHEDKTHLILPHEMIHRGFSLAVQIQQKKGIQTFTDQVRKEYFVRCRPTVMDWIQQKDGTIKVSESDKSENLSVVYLKVFVDSQGVHISCASQPANIPGKEDNRDHYCSLAPKKSLDPFLIHVDSLILSYLLSRPIDESLKKDGPLSHLPDEAFDRLYSVLGPGQGLPGFKGPATKQVNRFYDINQDCVETVLIYIPGAPETDQNVLFTNNQVMRVQIAAIDQNGKNDLAASRKLYDEILAIKDPAHGQKQFVNIEDLIRDIPAMTHHKDNWKQWEKTYQGKLFKAIGVFNTISIHPPSGKVFFLVTLEADASLALNQERQVAVWLVGAHKLRLGEKEGSFQFDSDKWINLGEKFSFVGRVDQYSLFDNEMVSAKHEAMIIIKVHEEDIAKV